MSDPTRIHHWEDPRHWGTGKINLIACDGESLVFVEATKGKLGTLIDALSEASSAGDVASVAERLGMSFVRRAYQSVAALDRDIIDGALLVRFSDRAYSTDLLYLHGEPQDISAVLEIVCDMVPLPTRISILDCLTRGEFPFLKVVLMSVGMLVLTCALAWALLAPSRALDPFESFMFQLNARRTVAALALGALVGIGGLFAAAGMAVMYLLDGIGNSRRYERYRLRMRA